MIEAFTPHAAQKAFTDGIRSRGVIWGCEHLDATRVRNPSEARSKLTIVIPKKVFRPLSICRGFPKRLGSPGIGGRSCHADMDDYARVQIDDEEGKQRTEEEIGDRQEVARPDLACMVMQKGRPCLASWPSSTDLPHVLLNGALRNVKAELEQFASDPLCSPESHAMRNELLTRSKQG